MTATVEKLHGPAARIEGFVDALDGTRLFGWSWDRLRPAERIRIEVAVAGQVVAEVTADHPRADLAANGIGDGSHAFEVDLVGLVPEGVEPEVVAVSPSTGERTTLKARGPEEQGAEAVALLRQVAGAIDLLGRGQRRLGAALSEQGRTQPSAPPEVTKALADIAAAQRELQKQQDCMEVFLVRFDGLLRQLSERIDQVPPPAPPAPGLLDRVTRLLSK